MNYFKWLNPLHFIAMVMFFATEAVKSSLITNTTALPRTINDAALDGGRVRVKRAVCTSVLAAADVGSTYRFFKVRSNDMVKDLVLDNATLGAGAAMDFGLYNVNADGSLGAVASQALFGSAIDMNAVNRNVSVFRESGTITVANMQKKLWELLALAADPQIEYEVVGTTTTIHAAAGSFCLTGEVVGGH